LAEQRVVQLHRHDGPIRHRAEDRAKLAGATARAIDDVRPDRVGERGRDAAHQLGRAQVARRALVMVEAAAAGVDMHDLWVGVGWSIVPGSAGGDELQLSVGSSAETNQDPDRRETIQVGGHVPYDCGWLPQRGCSRFPECSTTEAEIAGPADAPKRCLARLAGRARGGLVGSVYLTILRPDAESSQEV